MSLFLIATAALLITPGPAVLYIVARSIDQGRAAGVVSALGIGVGTLVHVAAAALGVAALLATSPLAHDLVKYLGAAYLLYLGVRRFAVREAIGLSESFRGRTLKSTFAQGVVVNVLNPKTALFVYAFLPQFVDIGRGSAAAQVVILGTLLVGMGVLSDSAYAVLSGSLGNWLRGNPAFLRAQRYLTGGVFIGLGLAAALSVQP